MGTRADFYLGKGPSAVWLGSVAYDGHPEKFLHLLGAKTANHFEQAVRAELDSRDDATSPQDGWPWPWETSALTDYSYTFDKGRVWACAFGHRWVLLGQEEPLPSPEDECLFPTFKTGAPVISGPRSGIIIGRIP